MTFETNNCRVFIGSSGNSIDLANALYGHLSPICKCKVWPHDVFQLSHTTLEDLIDQCSENDFAVFVWSPDDKSESKGIKSPAPRDNVVFETGLFMGRLGPKRVFSVLPDTRDVKVPSDLFGYTNTAYQTAEGIDSAHATLIAAGEIKKQMAKLGPIEIPVPENLFSMAVCYKFEGSSVKYRLVDTSNDRKIFPKGRVIDPSDIIASVKTHANVEAGAYGLVEIPQSKNFQYLKEDVGEFQNVTAHLLRVDIDKDVSRRNPEWMSYDEAVQKINMVWDGRNRNALLDLLNWAHDAISQHIPDAIELAAALPYRKQADGSYEIMTITSSSQNWLIPKGRLKFDEKPAAAAQREAMEEAGISGELSKTAIGTYTYQRENVDHHVTVFTLEVENQSEEWREMGLRKRQWNTPEKAIELVKEPDLKRLLTEFSQSLPK